MSEETTVNEPAEPPTNTGGGSESSPEPYPDESMTVDPPETQGGGG